jgi:hypothetical protein
MQRFAVMVSMAFVVVSCSPDGEVTGSTNKCATDIYPHTIPRSLISAWLSASGATTGSRRLARRHARSKVHADGKQKTARKWSVAKLPRPGRLGILAETGPALESSTQRQAAAKPISLADSGDLGAIVFFNSLLRPATLLAAFAQEWIALGCA